MCTVHLFFASRYRNESVITCSTPSVASVYSGYIVVMIDDEDVQLDPSLQFSYRDNPSFTSVQPQMTILE